MIDRLGSRRSFIAGTLLCAGASVGFASVQAVAGLIAFQVVFGLGRAIGWVASQTYISAIGPERDRAKHTGRFSFVSYVGQIVSPALVGVVATLAGYRWAFLTVAAYASVFSLVGLMLREIDTAAAKSQVGKGTGFRSASELFRVPQFRAAMVLTFVRLWISSVWSSFYPLFLVEEGFSAAVAGTVLSVSSLVAMTTTLAAGPLGRRSAPELVSAVALGVGAVGVIISPVLMTEGLVYVPAVLLGIGAGLSLPLLITTVSQATTEDRLGLALGVRAGVNQTSSALAPLAVAPLIGALGLTVGFGLAGVAGLVLLGIAFRKYWITPLLDRYRT